MGEQKGKRQLPFRRLVLIDGVTEEDVADIARELDWQLTHVQEASTEEEEDGSYRSLHWVTSDRLRAYNLVWDEIPYLIAQARLQEDADRSATDLQAAYPDHFYSFDEVLRAWDHAPDDDAAESAAFHLGLVASPTAGPEPAILTRIEVALEHPSPKVREAAIRGIGYARWPELKSALSKIAEGDEDEEVHDTAEAMLEAFEHFGWGH